MPENETTAGDTGLCAKEPDTSNLSLSERAIKQGWPMSDEKRREIADHMTKLAADPNTRPRSRAVAVRTLALLDQINLKAHALNQRDLHHTERLQHEAGILDLRMRRAEEGKPNDCIAVQIAPVKELPLPASLAGYVRRVMEPKEN